MLSGRDPAGVAEELAAALRRSREELGLSDLPVPIGVWVAEDALAIEVDAARALDDETAWEDSLRARTGRDRERGAVLDQFPYEVEDGRTLLAPHDLVHRVSVNELRTRGRHVDIGSFLPLHDTTTVFPALVAWLDESGCTDLHYELADADELWNL